mgnify:CR=1 FL=1
MTLQGIDVSSWQEGIDINNLAVDFVISKATQGTSYISPDCDRQMQQAMNRGLLVGVYHYIDGAGVDGEARHFANNIKGYLGKAIICLDWESEQNSAWGNVSYLDALVAKVKELTGVTPFIYASLSAFPWDIARKYGCGTWVAQYASMSQTGLQANPWNEGAYTCDIRQYSSAGRLDGYSGNIDLNKAYISPDDWQRIAGGADVNPTPTPTTGSVSTLNLLADVMRGNYGNGEVRKQALGSRYDEVQRLINHIASADTETLVDEVLRGEYGNGETRKTTLGSRYDEVQASVNERANGVDIDALARAVIRGKYGDGDVRRAALGSNYDAVQKRVNELMA